MTPLERQRGRLRLLRDAARLGDVTRERPRSTRRWLALAAAVAALGVGAAVAQQPADAPVAADVARSFASIGLSAARPITIIRPSVDAELRRARTLDLDRVELVAGTIDLEVRPLRAGERFVVATSDAEIEVRGTTFQVEAQGGKVRRVEVAEGKVQVRFRGRSLLLGAGESWRPEPEAIALVADAEDDPARRPAPQRSSSMPDGRRDGSTGAAPIPSGSTSTPDGRDFRDALRAMENGDYGDATTRLERFAAEHAGDDRAEDAAFLVVIALGRAGRHDEAVAAAKAYLLKFPDGFRRAEAAAIAGGTPGSGLRPGATPR